MPVNTTNIKELWKVRKAQILAAILPGRLTVTKNVENQGTQTREWKSNCLVYCLEARKILIIFSALYIYICPELWLNVDVLMVVLTNLKSHNFFLIVRIDAFGFRKTLYAQIKQLASKGIDVTRRSDPITPEVENAALWDWGHLSMETAMTLTNTIFF